MMIHIIAQKALARGRKWRNSFSRSSKANGKPKPEFGVFLVFLAVVAVILLLGLR